MKLNLKSVLLGAGVAVSTLSFGQLQDEQDVTMTMDLQPILQLSMEGPDQIDFTFDEINKYYTGVIKTGANILRVSASVSFDLWATGISSGSLAGAAGTERVWDNPVTYGVGVGGNSKHQIPLTALELHQFPANPSVAAGCGTTVALSSDYSAQFNPYGFATGGFGASAANAAVTTGNNSIYCTIPSTPYAPPLSTNAAGTSEKYIAGGSLLGAGCQVNAGSYLFGTPAGATTNFGNSTSASTNPQTVGGYYFVMDYRILPGLPATFPSTVAVNNTNSAAPYITLAAADGDVSTTPNFAAPGVYTMFVKYILIEDQ